MQEYILKIRGIVQGVGFRPFVAKLAKELNLNGYVENREAGVEVGLFCGREELEVFLNRLRTEKPAPAKIIEVNIRE
ncbi:MAG: carbamoyltransferase HypF, partial [Thermotogae bacterium]